MNAILNTEQDVRNAVRDMVASDNMKQEYMNADMRDWVQAALEFDMESDPDSYNILGALLSLPDEEFGLLAPAFLDEWQSNLNNINNKLLMAKLSNVMEIDSTEVINGYKALIEEVSKLTTLTPSKRSFLIELLTVIENITLAVSNINSKIINIPIEICHPDAKLPTYAHLTDSGMDVYALDDITINPGETKLVPTGIKVAIPEGYEIQVRPKSGRCLKTKLRIANTPGTIDAGYRDEIGVIIDNIEPYIKSAEMDENGRLYNVLFGSSYTIGKGEKFAQLVLSATPKIAWVQVEKLNTDEDRGGGFGSTGLK